MPLGPNDAGNTDPFLGSASLNYKYPVTGGAPGSVTPSADRGYVSSDISDELALSDNTQGDFSPSDETLAGQHADPLHLVPDNMSQKPMPRQGFTAGEVAAKLQISQQQQNSFPYTSVESLVQPVAAQGSLDPEDTSVHSDVANEVPALKDINVVVRDNDPSNDSVHSDPFEGGEVHTEAPESEPSDLAVTLSWTAETGYEAEFSVDAAPAGEGVVAWVLFEKDANDIWNPVLVPFEYAWTNTTPNRLLDAAFVTMDNSSFGFYRNTDGIFEFAVKSINQYGNTSPLSDPVTLFALPGPSDAAITSAGNLSWDAVSGVTEYSYMVTLDEEPSGAWTDVSATSVLGYDLSGFDPGDVVFLHVKVKGSPRYSSASVTL